MVTVLIHYHDGNSFAATGADDVGIPCPGKHLNIILKRP